jgi:hypothetical protein
MRLMPDGGVGLSSQADGVGPHVDMAQQTTRSQPVTDKVRECPTELLSQPKAEWNLDRRWCVEGWTVHPTGRMLAVATDQGMTWISGNRTVGTAEARRAPGGSGPDRRLRLIFALAALPVLVAGCADSDGSVTPKAPTSETGGTVTTDLTIVSDNGNGKTETWTLTCDPAGGTHPTAEAACAALTAKGKMAMPAVAKDKICTQIYGGPQTAKITGTWQGEAVNASFSRKNGCEISRWQSLKGLLPTVAGAAGAQ